MVLYDERMVHIWMWCMSENLKKKNTFKRNLPFHQREYMIIAIIIISGSYVYLFGLSHILYISVGIVLALRSDRKMSISVDSRYLYIVFYAFMRLRYRAASYTYPNYIKNRLIKISMRLPVA